MITTTYNYQETLAASVKANWRVEDIIGGDKRLDFTKPFMPDSLARVEFDGFFERATRRSCSIRFAAMAISALSAWSKNSFCLSCWTTYDRN